MLAILLRKLRTFYQNPRKAWAKRHPLLLLANAWASYKLRRHNLLPLLAGRPADAIPPVPHDLWRLYKAARRADTIVELGSGCSTLIMAEALRRKGYGRLYSFDTSAEWLAVTQRDLGRNAHVLLFPSTLKTVDIEMPDQATPDKAVIYTAVPDIEADLIYVDGPAHSDLPVAASQPVKMRTVNPLFMRLAPGTRIIVDGRKGTVRMLAHHLKRKPHGFRALGATSFYI